MKGPDAHYLLIVFAEIKVGNPISFLVCHMGDDPSERFDVAADHPEVLKTITEAVARHKASVKPVENQLIKR